jgi:regulator of replication initiation timing
MDESEPLTAAQIAERKQDRLEQARIHVAHVKRECTPDSPMYSARDFARMIRAVECIEGEIDRALLHVEQLQSENATLRDRLAKAEARERELRAALQRIKNDEGRVCNQYEICDHVACNSSYAAWAIADAALAPRSGRAND